MGCAGRGHGERLPDRSRPPCPGAASRSSSTPAARARVHTDDAVEADTDHVHAGNDRSFDQGAAGAGDVRCVHGDRECGNGGTCTVAVESAAMGGPRRAPPRRAPPPRRPPPARACVSAAVAVRVKPGTHRPGAPRRHGGRRRPLRGDRAHSARRGHRRLERWRSASPGVRVVGSMSHNGRPQIGRT